MLTGYKKYQWIGLQNLNYRNATHIKKFKTSTGEMTLTISEEKLRV